LNDEIIKYVHIKKVGQRVAAREKI